VCEEATFAFWSLTQKETYLRLKKVHKLLHDLYTYKIIVRMRWEELVALIRGSQMHTKLWLPKCKGYLCFTMLSLKWQ
jgi:hypothetical protein